MAATLTAAPVFLPAPTVLAHEIGAPVDIDWTGEAVCRECGTTIYHLVSLTSGWVDIARVETEAATAYRDHLDSDESRRSCYAG